MKRKLRILGLVLFAALLLMQFVPVELPANEENNPDDLIRNGLTDEAVAPILKASCYDCHSNEVIYPWYTKVKPVTWLIRHDVQEGREELNFSTWNAMNKRRMLRKLEEIKEVVEKDEMPLPIYTVMHRGAKLTNDQKLALSAWADRLNSQLLQ